LAFFFFTACPSSQNFLLIILYCGSIAYFPWVMLLLQTRKGNQMTRTEALKHLKRIGVTTVRDAVAEGYVVLTKHLRGEKLLQGEVVSAGLVWYEFFANGSNDSAELAAAAATQEWLRTQLKLDNNEMFAEEQRMGRRV
jgi:pyocin large subunit-like protein